MKNLFIYALVFSSFSLPLANADESNAEKALKTLANAANAGDANIFVSRKPGKTPPLGSGFYTPRNPQELGALKLRMDKDGKILSSVKPHWRDHPELVEQLSKGRAATPLKTNPNTLSKKLVQRFVASDPDVKVAGTMAVAIGAMGVGAAAYKLFNDTPASVKSVGFEKKREVLESMTDVATSTNLDPAR